MLTCVHVYIEIQYLKLFDAHKRNEHRSIHEDPSTLRTFGLSHVLWMLEGGYTEWERERPHQQQDKQEPQPQPPSQSKIPKWSQHQISPSTLAFWLVLSSLAELPTWQMGTLLSSKCYLASVEKVFWTCLKPFKTVASSHITATMQYLPTFSLAPRCPFPWNSCPSHCNAHRRRSNRLLLCSAKSLLKKVFETNPDPKTISSKFAPKNRLKPKRKQVYSNHPFSGAKSR